MDAIFTRITATGYISERHIRAIRAALTSAALSLLLSSCCIFGVTTTRYNDWEANFPNDASAIKASCEMEIGIQIEHSKKQFVQMVATECGKEKPFADYKAVNPSTGADYGSSLASYWAEELCPDWKQTQKIAEYKFLQFCRGCGQSKSDLEGCYKQNGLLKVERTGIACQPMRLF